MGYLARRQGVKATSGNGIPASTPNRKGDLYIDTGSGQSYIATGTATSADWKAILTS